MTLAFQAAAIIDIAFNLSSPSPIKEVAKASADSQASDKALSEFAVSQAVRTLLYSQSGDGSATVKTASIAFDGLSVRAPGGTVHPAKTLPQALLNTFGPDQVNFVRNATSSWLGGKADESSGKAILTNFIGLVKPGEMLFVLGRPGSGCSTFLQTAANRSALNMTGKLSYSNMSAAEFGRQHERETVYLSEEDRHITSLSVRDILNFALRTSLPPKTRTKSVVKSLVNTIADHLGLMHALHTSVGGALFPGVSGGERKRVSIGEVFATGYLVQCSDNSTRGLDSSTALGFIKAFQVVSDPGQKTAFATLYQPGEDTYRHFDNFLLLDKAREVFFGRTSEARACIGPTLTQLLRPGDSVVCGTPSRAECSAPLQ